MMREISFIREWNQRASFVAAIAIVNTLVITAHVLLYYQGLDPFRFWLIGIGLTGLLCVSTGLFMLTKILLDRRRRSQARERLRMWQGVLPYDPAKAAAEKAGELQS